MKLEQQVCALEQAKRLKELGITCKPFFYHVHLPETKYRSGNHWTIGDSHFIEGMTDIQELLPAFTVAELGVMLPRGIKHKDGEYYFMSSHSNGVDDREGKIVVWYEDNNLDPENEVLEQYFSEDSEAEARAALLIYLLENKLITAEQVNTSLK